MADGRGSVVSQRGAAGSGTDHHLDLTVGVRPRRPRPPGGSTVPAARAASASRAEPVGVSVACLELVRDLGALRRRDSVPLRRQVDDGPTAGRSPTNLCAALLVRVAASTRDIRNRASGQRRRRHHPSADRRRILEQRPIPLRRESLSASTNCRSRTRSGLSENIVRYRSFGGLRERPRSAELRRSRQQALNSDVKVSAAPNDGSVARGAPSVPDRRQRRMPDLGRPAGVR